MRSRSLKSRSRHFAVCILVAAPIIFAGEAAASDTSERVIEQDPAPGILSRADVDEIRLRMTEGGISPATQDALISKIDRGELPDSAL